MSHAGQFALFTGNPRDGYAVTGEERDAYGSEVSNVESADCAGVQRRTINLGAGPEVLHVSGGHRAAHSAGDAAQAARREACQSISAKEKERVWAQVMAYARQCGKRGFIVDDLVRDLGGTHNHWAPRCTELKDLLKLRATGERRPTRAKRQAAVLRCE